MRRWVPLVSLLAIVATACGGGEGGTTGEGLAETVRFDQPAPSPREDVPSALDNPDDERLPAPLVDTAEIISGGPPPDGIPPIDEPTFQAADAADWLEDNEPVLALEVDGEWRAYPVPRPAARSVQRAQSEETQQQDGDPGHQPEHVRASPRCERNQGQRPRDYGALDEDATVGAWEEEVG